MTSSSTNFKSMGEDKDQVKKSDSKFSSLLRTWRGQSEGEYSTIPSFLYREELCFSHSGKLVIAYILKTWESESKEHMHADTGYFRPKPDGSIEAVIA
ncbi:unnamed protein product [Arabis nemorensis]|uniref:THAP4-like heme-binding domain-containing protein n=1 Tax=Arabis nemorensis TaxID=586526 RepID=A0A565BLC2_9BRAS|nr:unnamed protein product [Arabis nemorensis]